LYGKLPKNLGKKRYTSIVDKKYSIFTVQKVHFASFGAGAQGIASQIKIGETSKGKLRLRSAHGNI